MNPATQACPELDDACAQWHRLARAEGDAIRVGDWAALEAAQNGLAQLQPRMTRSLRVAREHWVALGAEQAGVESQLQARVRPLLELANENAALLRQARLTLQMQLGQSRQVARTLGRLRASYAPPGPAAWTSFS